MASFSKLYLLHILRMTFKFDCSKPPNALMTTKIQTIKYGFDSSYIFLFSANQSKTIHYRMSSLKTELLLISKRFLKVI